MFLFTAMFCVALAQPSGLSHIASDWDPGKEFDFKHVKRTTMPKVQVPKVTHHSLSNDAVNIATQRLKLSADLRRHSGILNTHLMAAAGHDFREEIEENHLMGKKKLPVYQATKKPPCLAQIKACCGKHYNNLNVCQKCLGSRTNVNCVIGMAQALENHACLGNTASIDIFCRLENYVFAPSVTPTPAPTMTPTFTPSRLPTASPSPLPTHVPTFAPTTLVINLIHHRFHIVICSPIIIVPGTDQNTNTSTNTSAYRTDAGTHHCCPLASSNTHTNNGNSYILPNSSYTCTYKGSNHC